MLDVPPIDAIPQPEEVSLAWYTGTAPQGSNDLPKQLTRDVDYHISLSMQLMVLNIPSWYNNKMYQALYSNFYTGSDTRSRRFKLVVSKYTHT